MITPFSIVFIMIVIFTLRQAKEQLNLILSSIKDEFQKVLQYCYFSEREVAML